MAWDTPIDERYREIERLLDKVENSNTIGISSRGYPDNNIFAPFIPMIETPIIHSKYANKIVDGRFYQKIVISPGTKFKYGR